MALTERFGVIALAGICTHSSELLAYLQDMHQSEGLLFHYHWQYDRVKTFLNMLPDIQDKGAGEDDKQSALEETIQGALERSIQVAMQEESAHVTEAILRSKVDAPDSGHPLSGDGIVVLRLTRMARSPHVTSALLESLPLRNAAHV